MSYFFQIFITKYKGASLIIKITCGVLVQIAEAKPDVTPLFCNGQVKLLMLHSRHAAKSSNHWCSAK